MEKEQAQMPRPDLIDRKIELLQQHKEAPYKRLRPCFKPFGAGFEQPTPEQVREAFEGYTGAEIAEMLGVDPRSVRRWLQEEDASGARAIPYAAWRLFLILTAAVPAV